MSLQSPRRADYTKSLNLVLRARDLAMGAVDAMDWIESAQSEKKEDL